LAIALFFSVSPGSAWFWLSSDTFLGTTTMPMTLPTIPVRSTEAGSIDDVMEFGLLLPKNRALELIDLAKQRHETVGQLLRSLIDDALHAQKVN
jgi:hypothetical protein